MKQVRAQPKIILGRQPSLGSRLYALGYNCYVECLAQFEKTLVIGIN
jgi:hypothetical protein